MAKVEIFGLGAAGNKAAIHLIEVGLVPREKVVLINSTLKDIPKEYHDRAISIGDSIGGCGKERDRAKEFMIDAIKSEKIVPETYLDGDENFVCIISSTEGGTGSGSSVVLAEYFSSVLEIPVHMVGFPGFEDDVRGLGNTVEYFQDLSENYIVEAICNKKFSGGVNRLVAESFANQELATRLRILLGVDLIDSVQNIDPTDLHKVITTPGFMTIERSNFNKLKSIDQFNKLCTEMMIASKTFDILPTASRMAIIINASKQSQDYIDFNFEILRKYLGGHSFEVFTHIQDNGGQEYISVIAAGLKMPLAEIKNIYKQYEEQANQIDTSNDEFFDEFKNLNTKNLKDKFNVGKIGVKKNISTIDKEAKDKFLNNIAAKKKSSGFLNTTINSDTKMSDF